MKHVEPDGAPVQDKATGSTNPFCPATVIVAFPDCPTPTVREFVERLAVKSPIFSWADADRDATPFDNDTVKG
jgi:hypothetical protein